MKHELTRTSPTKVFRYPPETTEQQAERVEVSTQSTIQTVETSQQRAVQLQGVEQTKAAKIETEPSIQRAERLEVLSKTKEER